MPYPEYYSSVYINPSGNIEASGYYKSHITNELANMYPYWTDIRSDSSSVAQAYMTPFARILHSAEKDLSKGLNEKFITLAPIDEVDVLYRIKVPSNISFLNNPEIQCWTAPSGATPSGYPFPLAGAANTANQIQAEEVSDLERFYYHVLPTRIKVFNSETYSAARATSLGVSFPIKSSGIIEYDSKYVDIWKREHDLTWAHADSGTTFLKQDSDTMETYESWLAGASGDPKGFTMYNGMLWWIGKGYWPSWDLSTDLSGNRVVHYKMDDNASSTVVVDDVGTSNGTSQQNTSLISVTGANSESNGALSFNGTSDYIDTNATWESTFQGSFSISFWANINDGRAGGQEILVGSSHTPPFDDEIYFRFDAVNGKMSFYYKSNNDMVKAGTADPVFSNGPQGWHYFTVVAVADTQLYIYVDAVEITLESGVFNGDATGVTFSDFSMDNNLYVGAENLAGSDIFHFDGDIDNFVIVNKALTATEVSNQFSVERFFLNISNPHPRPGAKYLDTLAIYNITDMPGAGISPSGIDIDDEGHIWILDDNRTTLYALDAMYDYFLVDKENRWVYFREDYSDPGVFVKPA